MEKKLRFEVEVEDSDGIRKNRKYTVSNVNNEATDPNLKQALQAFASLYEAGGASGYEKITYEILI